MFGRPVGGNAGTPSFPQRFGTIQDVNIDLDQKLAELRGQNKFPDDVAPADMTMKGKSGFASIEVEIYNSLFFADTIVAGIKKMIDGEAQTVPAMAAYTVTVTNAATFYRDLAVRYADGSGYLQQVTAGTEAAGKYSVVETGGGKGVYTFAAADAAKALLFSYVQTVSGSGRTMTVKNHIMGYGPIFELWLMMPYQGDNGMHIFNARASKMSAPLKRDGYMIADFEFECFPNSAGDLFEWFQTTA